jgi:hypothetical protein
MPILKMDKKGRVVEVSTANHKSQGVGRRPAMVTAGNTIFSEKDPNAKGNNYILAAQKRNIKAQEAQRKRQAAQLKKAEMIRIAMKKKNIAHVTQIRKALSNAKSDIIMEGVRQGFQRTAPDSNFDNLNPVVGNGLRRFDGRMGPTTDFEVLIDALPFTQYPSQKQDASAVHQFIIDGPEIVDVIKQRDIPAVGANNPAVKIPTVAQKAVAPETIGIPRGMDPLFRVFGLKRKVKVK